MAEEGLQNGPPVSGEEQIRRVIENVRTHTLDDLPGKFSRLIYLASLRDHNSGRYSHYGLECRYPSDAVDEGLRRSHASAFEDLLSAPLQEQTEDLIRFFESLSSDRSRLVEVWKKLRAYEILPPENCPVLARQLFSNNVEVILRLLKQTAVWELLDDPHRNSNHLT